jgi:hypothetical protein
MAITTRSRYSRALRAYLGHCNICHAARYSGVFCETITVAYVPSCRIWSNGSGRAMRHRTGRDGQSYSSLRAIRGRCIGTARHLAARLGGYGENGTPSVNPRGSCSVAYMDVPILIGHGQTMSQPFIVGLMTHLAAVKSDETVLEVGKGSGYQAAVLARLVRKVCTVEIIPSTGRSRFEGVERTRL